MRDISNYFAAKHAFVSEPNEQTAKQFLTEANKFHGKELTADKDFVDMHMEAN